MFRAPLLTIVGCAMWIGCGTAAPGSGIPGPDSGVPPAGALSVSPTSQRVLAGSGAVTIRATLTGASVPIGWTLTGPGTLGATSGEGTTYTPPATVDLETVATVTASAAPGLSATVSITVVPSAQITVTGRVVGVPGNGLAGLTVAIGATATVTDANGRFSIAGVTPPYDLAVVAPGTPAMAGVHQALTRPDPTIVFLFLVPPGEANTGVVSGTVSEGDPIPSDGEVTGAVFASPEASGLATLDSRDYTLPLSWFGPTTTTGTVHVLQWKRAGPDRLPTSYIGFGSVTAVRVTAGQTNDEASVQLFAPGTASISGDIIAPAGSTVFTKSLSLEFSDHALLPLGNELTPDLHFAYPVPANITLTAVVTAISEFTSGAASFRRESGIARGATDVQIVLPTPALPSTPADGASGVAPGTEFRWSAFAGGVHLVIFDGQGASPSYYVVTRETSTRIPDLPALGAAFPAGASYDWFVVGIGPFASVDDFAGTGALQPRVGSFDESVSDFRFFVTE